MIGLDYRSGDGSLKGVTFHPIETDDTIYIFKWFAAEWK